MKRYKIVKETVLLARYYKTWSQFMHSHQGYKIFKISVQAAVMIAACNQGIMAKNLYSDQANCRSNSHDFYAGLNIGMANLHSRTQADHDPEIKNSKALEDYFLSDNNFAGDVRLGWNFLNGSKWLWGVEGSAGSSALNAQDTYLLNILVPVQAKTTLKERYNFGVAAKLGYKITEAASIYLKLGAKFSRFRFSYQDIVNGVGQSVQSKNSLRTGFDPGLGFNLKLNNNWSLNGEYSYTFYNALKLDNADAENNGLNYKTKPKIGRFMVGLVYHFGKK